MKQQKSGRSVRLVGGPFSGKRFDTPEFGKNTILFRGEKPMSRREKYGWQVGQMRSQPYFSPIDNHYGMRYPMVQAEYALCRKPIASGGMVFHVNLEHPDGSLFYEFTGNKREF